MIVALLLSLSAWSQDLTRLPELVDEVAPVYPEQAAAAGIEAEVHLQIDVDVDGRVEDVIVVTPVGHGFDEAAVQAALQFRFTPALVGDEPVPVRIDYVHHFVLEEVVTPVAAAVGQLRGVIKERGVRAPIDGIAVVVSSTVGEFRVRTDADGAFVVPDLPVGTWAIEVSGDGWRTYRTEEAIVEGEALTLSLWIHREVTSAYDVVVEGEIARKEVVRHTLSAEAIERVPGTFGDPIGVVQNLPGVSPQGFGDGSLIVRGTTPQDTGLYLGGIRLPLFYHFGALRSVVPAGMLEEITFTPGNAPLKYGRITGGVLEVTPKQLDVDAIHGYVDVNLFDSSAWLELPVGPDLSLAFGGRRSYADLFLDLVLPEDGPVALQAAPKFWDAQAMASWTPDARHHLQLVFIASGDRFAALFDNPRDLDPQFSASDFDASVEQAQLALQHDWQLGEGVSNHLRIAGLIADQDFTVGPEQRLLFHQDELHIRETFDAQLHERVGLSVGGDGFFGSSDAEVYFQGPPKEGGFEQSYDEAQLSFTDTTEVVGQGGGFAELSVEPVAGWTVVGGARADGWSALDTPTFDPRVTTRVDLSEQLALKAGYGLFHGAPTPDELDEGFGNPLLGPETSRQLSGGFAYRPVPYLLIDATGFHNDLRDQVSPTDRAVVRNGEVEPLRYDNGGAGRVSGLELLVKHDLHNNFSGWIAYTFSRAERLDTDRDRWRLFDYDRPHVLTAVAAYRLPRNWEVSGRFRYMSGQPYTPIKGAVFVSDDDLYAPIPGRTNSARDVAVYTIDLRIDKRFAFRTWMLDVYLDVQNVTNNTKTGGVTWNYDYSESEQEAGMPIFPALGVRAVF